MRGSDGRNAELRVETADEIREVLEACLESYFCDRLTTGSETTGSIAQPRADYPLMRRETGDDFERAQEMIGAESRQAGQLGQRVRLIRMKFQMTQHLADPHPIAGGG